MNAARRTWFLLIALTAAVGAGLYAAGQKAPQQADVLFESARQKETFEGKLQEAIQIYQRIVQDHVAANRPVAAKALLRIGQCYERLGQADARRAYERLVREFGDQAETVAEARARLAALSAPAPAKNPELVVRRISDADLDLTGSPSSDGRRMATTDWYTGNIVIRDLTTGETHTVTTTGDIMKSTVFGFYAKYSPDQKQIAYSWYDPKSSLFELRVVGADGAGVRTLYRKEDEMVFPETWTPDGRFVVASVSVMGEGRIVRSYQLVLVSAEDGAARVLKSSGRWGFGRVAVSPDGRFLVYDAAQADGKTDIALMSLPDGRESRLVEHPADDSRAIWTPDGQRVLFVSDRTGRAGLWAIEVTDGKAAAPPELLRPEMRIDPIGFTSGGALFYGLTSDVGDVYVSTFDQQAGRLLDRPTPVSQRIVARRSLASWSPDGKHLAYVSTPEPAPPGSTITLRAVDTGEERDIHVDFRPARSLGWFPDGSALVASASDTERRPCVFRIDVKSGAVTTLAQRKAQSFFQAYVTKDGRTLVFLTYANDGQMLGTRDLQTGQENIILERGLWPTAIGLSPDGRQVAVTAAEGPAMDDPQALLVIPVSGGERRTLHRIEKPWSFLRFAAWTPDGSKILCGTTRLGPALQGKTEYLLVPVAGGAPRKLASPIPGGIGSFSFHPDGQRVAFASSRSRSEVWVIENFLPAAKQ